MKFYFENISDKYVYKNSYLEKKIHQTVKTDTNLIQWNVERLKGFSRKVYAHDEAYHTRTRIDIDGGSIAKEDRRAGT